MPATPSRPSGRTGSISVRKACGNISVPRRVPPLGPRWRKPVAGRRDHALLGSAAGAGGTRGARNCLTIKDIIDRLAQHFSHADFSAGSLHDADRRIPVRCRGRQFPERAGRAAAAHGPRRRRGRPVGRRARTAPAANGRCAGRELVPLASYVPAARGAAPACRRRIPLRYPLLELAAGATALGALALGRALDRGARRGGPRLGPARARGDRRPARGCCRT